MNSEWMAVGVREIQRSVKAMVEELSMKAVEVGSLNWEEEELDDEHAQDVFEQE